MPVPEGTFAPDLKVSDFASADVFTLLCWPFRSQMERFENELKTKVKQNWNRIEMKLTQMLLLLEIRFAERKDCAGRLGTLITRTAESVVP